MVLKKAVKSRFLEGSNLYVVDADSVEILKEKLKSPFPEEVVYTLEILRNADVEDFQELLGSLIDHGEPEVQKRALDLVEAPVSPEMRDELRQLLSSETHTELRIAAIHTWCRVAEDQSDPIYPLLQHHHPEIRRAAITALMQTGGIEPIVLGGQSLLELIASPEERDKINAAGIIGTLGVAKFYQPLESFMTHPSAEVRLAGIAAAGKLATPQLVPALLNLFDEGKHRFEVLQQLPSFGNGVLPYLSQKVAKSDISRRDLLEFLRVCGRIETPEAQDLLWQFTGNKVATIRERALFSLQSSNYKTRARESCEAFLKAEFDHAFQLIKARECLKGQAGMETLIGALRTESEEALDRIMALLGFMYNRRSLMRARIGISSGNKEKLANGLEIIDNLLPNRLSGPLIPILEYEGRPGTPGALAQMGRGFADSGEVISFVFREGDLIFNRWTLAVALDRSRSQTSLPPVDLIRSYLKHPDLLVSQLASALIQSDPNPEDMEYVSLLEIEKVIVLKNTELFSQTPEEFLVDVARIV